MEFYQCTTMQYFDNILLEKIYNSLFLVVVYVVPLLVIVVTYANIILKIFRKSKENLQTDDDEVPPAPRLRFRSSRNGKGTNGSIALRRNVTAPTK